MQNDSKSPDDFLLDDENFSDPYQVIAGFFDLCSVCSHRRRIVTWMESVNKNDYWRESSPSDLLFYYKKLVNLVIAVHIIYKKNKKRKTAIDLLNEKDYDINTNLLHPALYFGWGCDETIWDDFPRCLSLEEYIDPYLVFPQFFALYELDDWCKELYELLSDGLSGNNPGEIFCQDRNMLLIRKNLIKLVEAVHLIDIREIEYKGSFKKRYPFTLNKPCEDLPAAQILKIKLNERNELRSLKDENPSKDDENEDDDKHDEGDHEDNDESYDNDGANDDGSEDRQEGSQEGILSKALNSNLKKVNITIRGNYIVNHPPAAGRIED